MGKSGNGRRSKSRHTKSIVICVIAAIILFVLGLYNAVKNAEDFWSTNITSLLSISAVLFISYYLTQMRNDERKRIDNIERLVMKIQAEISSETLYCGKSNMCLMYQRSLNNKIEYLQEQNLSSIGSGLDYIHEQFQTYRDMYADHMNDTDFPASIEQDFSRIVVNIVDRCDKMLIELRK